MNKKKNVPKSTGYKKPDIETFRDVAMKKAGIVSDIAQALNCGRRTVYDWIQADKDFQDAISDAKEGLHDIVENRIVMLAKGIPKIMIDENGNKVIDGWKVRPDQTMLIWLSKTQMKHRGYVERTEVDNDPKGTFQDWLQKTSKPSTNKPKE